MKGNISTKERKKRFLLSLIVSLLTFWSIGISISIATPEAVTHIFNHDRFVLGVAIVGEIIFLLWFTFFVENRNIGLLLFVLANFTVVFWMSYNFLFLSDYHFPDIAKLLAHRSLALYKFYAGLTAAMVLLFLLFPTRSSYDYA